MKRILSLTIVALLLPILSLNAQDFGLGKTMLLHGKMSLNVPEELEAMPFEVIKVKIGGTSLPDHAFSDPYMNIILSVRGTEQRISERSLETYLNMLDQQYKAIYKDGAKWEKKEIIEINGKQVAVFSFEEPENYGASYNLIFVLIVDGEAVQVDFRCQEAYKEKWIPRAQEILMSVKGV